MEKLLEGKSQLALQLFHAFLDEYRKIGPFTLHPVKARVALLTQMRFCAINKWGSDYLDGHLVLVESMAHLPCFRKMENLGDRFFVHHFRLKAITDITEDLKHCMHMAYAVGNRTHVKRKVKNEK